MSNLVDEKWYLRRSAEQRLKLIQEIWQSLSGQHDAPEGEDLLRECERRLAEMKADPAKRISWQELCELRGRGA